jgi:hypothetical protein
MGSAKGDLLIVVLLLIGLGIAWVYTGGPSRSISHSGGVFNGAPWPFGTGGNAYTVPTINLDAADTNYGGSSYSPSGGTYGTGGQPGDSTYASVVRLENSGEAASEPGQEYVALRTSSSLKNSITITGWTLENGSGNTKVTIGSAVGTPLLGQVNSEAPITLGPGSIVYVVTGRPPNGGSFRLNKCTGYFGGAQSFIPSLPRDCPLPSDELARASGRVSPNSECTNFVRDLAQCSVTVSAIPQNVGAACQDFILNTLSYNGCVTDHRSDPDFYKNEWRVYLNQSHELWGSVDRIVLRDENGKVVSTLNY